MPRTFAEWIEFLYGPIFRVIGFFYRVYTANRARVDRLRQKPRVAWLLRTLTILVLVGWILVWYLAPEENRNLLSEEIRHIFGMDRSAADN